MAVKNTTGRGPPASLSSPTMELTRRHFIGLSAAACATPLLAKCEGSALPSVASDFLLAPDEIYLNAGSVGACPRRVLDVHRQTWEQLERSPTQQAYSVLLPKAEEVRAKAAAFLGCQPDELTIAHNTTDAMNQIAQGLDLQPGDQILTTDHEHPGGSLCWSYYARHRQISITPVPLPLHGDAETILQRFTDAITPATRVISVSHITYTTGMLLPIQRLAELAHRHDALLIVDGAQAAGQIPVNLSELGCDAYATSPHKWLLAPKGSGLLVIRKQAQSRIQPIALQNGYRVYTGATGTRDLPAILALGEALDFISERGMASIHAHNTALRDAILANLPAGITNLSPSNSSPTMVTLGLPTDVSPSVTAKSLYADHRITVRAISTRTVSGIRISPHIYSTLADIQRLLKSLPF